MMSLALPEFALRIACAFALGALIGFERQWRQRMAGLQTQIAAYIVSGVGFLTGAVIFRENLSITGLNTAGTMWTSAAVGTLAGVGAYAEAVVGAAFILAVNVVLRPIGQLMNRETAS
jgi:putative Mg2+ transporter-C (MgtC) family protein